MYGVVCSKHSYSTKLHLNAIFNQELLNELWCKMDPIHVSFIPSPIIIIIKLMKFHLSQHPWFVNYQISMV